MNSGLAEGLNAQVTDLAKKISENFKKIQM